MDLILLVILSLIPKKSKLIKICIISLIASMIVILLQMTLFVYLFGHCAGCRFIGYEDIGIDFSRDENVLGAKTLDANNMSGRCEMVIGIITIFFACKDIRKKEIKKSKKVILTILVIILTIVEYLELGKFKWM